MKPDDLTKLRELLSSFSTAMMVTRTGDDHLHTRPMALAQVEESGTIWFITADESSKVREIVHDTRVHLVFQNERSLYLSVNGIATPVHDKQKVEELWKEPFRVWFPHGKDDARIVLIAVEPQDAEYWDSQGWNKITYLFKAAKAYVSGQTPEVEEGKEHGLLTS